MFQGDSQQNINQDLQISQEEIINIPNQYRPIPKFMKQLDCKNKKYLKKDSSTMDVWWFKTNTMDKKISGGKVNEMVIQHQNQWTLENGVRIKGNNKTFDGYVEIQYPNGSIFKGYYERGIRIKGYIKFPNGFQYRGGFINDEFRGEGLLKFPNGKKIEGEWINGTIQGKAKITYPSGDVYFGEIFKMKKHGKGYVFFTDNSKYVGQFQNGKIEGYGQYFKEDSLYAQGIWNDGLLITPTLKSGQDLYISLKSEKLQNTKNLQ